MPAKMAITKPSLFSIANSTKIPPCGARDVVPNAMHSAPVMAPPNIIDGITRSGSAAANGIAPSEMNVAPRSQAVRAENRQLRKRIDAAENAAHQAMGTAATRADPDEHAELKADNARLAIQLANNVEHVRNLQQQLTETQEELVAAKQLNSDYFQQLKRVLDKP